MTIANLLPPNATQLERAVAEACAFEPEDLVIDALWSADAISADFLPYLAWVLGVDFWDLLTTDEQRREAVKGAIAWHKKRGTPWAMKQALAARGYLDCEIIEHAQLYQQWLAAGGETLNGDSNIDGSGDLSAPTGFFRFTTNHWAEYALRLNAVDGVTTREMLQRITDLCEAYAPKRSRLAAILLFAAAQFEAVTRMGSWSARGRVQLKNCKRISVPSFETLDGCDVIGGTTLIDYIDGAGFLDGSSLLNAERYEGDPLDGGQLAISAVAGRTQMCGTALGGNRKEPLEFLDATDYLDGRYTISGETLDGFGVLDGGDLRYPTLADHEDTLDGTSNLGEVEGPERIWFSGIVRIKRGSSVYQEAL